MSRPHHSLTAIELDGAPVYIIDDIHSDDEESDPELYSSSSDSNSSVETLSSFEVHDYFQEIQGRMFPADANVAISLPQDSAEVQRSLNHHRIFKMILRSNYWGPVDQVLAPIPGQVERKKVLDMITAEGSWVQEMALQFPHVDFLSVDHVPLTAHVPRPNITFEVYDLHNGIAAPDESFDMVHIRACTAHIRNPKDWIKDIHRVLKPGGLLLFVDSELDVFDGKNPDRPAGDKFPGLDAALQLVRNSLTQQSVNPYLWRDLPKMLAPRSDLWSSQPQPRGMTDHGKKLIGFRTIRHKAHLFPANSLPNDRYYKVLGQLAGDTWKAMWRNMEIPFQIYGMEPEVARRIVQGAVGDLERMDQAVAAKTQTVYAFKI